VSDARAERIATTDETAALALGQPEATFTFAALEEDAAGKGSAPSSEAKVSRTERLELFAPTAENLVPARVEGRDAVLLLRREMVDQIRSKLQAVRDAKPPAAEPTPGPPTPVSEPRASDRP
jgi:hypothetical protein